MPSEGILCCRSTTAFMPCSRPFPHLTRSSLHRCLQRNGISRLPQVEGKSSAKRKFKAYPIGYFHIDLAEVRTAQGKLYLLVAIDRTSKFALVGMHEKVARRTAGDFLRRLITTILQGPHRPHRQRNPLHHARQYEFSRTGHQGRPGGWRAGFAPKRSAENAHCILLKILNHCWDATLRGALGSSMARYPMRRPGCLRLSRSCANGSYFQFDTRSCLRRFFGSSEGWSCLKQKIETAQDAG